jgi:hypothetical protein
MALSSRRPLKSERVSPKHLQGFRSKRHVMGTTTIELDEDLHERLAGHCEEDESVAEFIEELVSMYETEGAFIQEGYSE